MSTALERLIRDRNFYELEYKTQIKKMAKMHSEIEYLKKRDKVLTALENSLPKRIATYEENNAPTPIIKELEYIKNMLELEKDKLQKEEQQDEEQEY